jgi:hypothetical protein
MDYGFWIMDYGLWIMICGLWSMIQMLYVELYSVDNGPTLNPKP